MFYFCARDVRLIIEILLGTVITNLFHRKNCGEFDNSEYNAITQSSNKCFINEKWF